MQNTDKLESDLQRVLGHYLSGELDDKEVSVDGGSAEMWFSYAMGSVTLAVTDESIMLVDVTSSKEGGRGLLAKLVLSGLIAAFVNTEIKEILACVSADADILDAATEFQFADLENGSMVFRYPDEAVVLAN